MKWKKCLALFDIFYSGLVCHFLKEWFSFTIIWLFTTVQSNKKCEKHTGDSLDDVSFS